MAAPVRHNETSHNTLLCRRCRPRLSVWTPGYATRGLVSSGAMLCIPMTRAIWRLTARPCRTLAICGQTNGQSALVATLFAMLWTQNASRITHLKPDPLCQGWCSSTEICNPSCYLLKSMGFCLTLTVKSPISLQGEPAHGRQNYHDVLPM